MYNSSYFAANRMGGKHEGGFFPPNILGDISIRVQSTGTVTPANIVCAVSKRPRARHLFIGVIHVYINKIEFPREVMLENYLPY